MANRILILFIFAVAFANVQGQSNIYKTNRGNISFRSEAPLEIISASSNALEGIIDQQSMTFAFVIPIHSFKGFNNGLQQQHFYENYLETSKYPKASFTGKIIEDVDFSVPGTYHVRAKGLLNIHGRSQERIIKTELVSNGKEINAKAFFLVPLVDHQIEIPRVVNQKIAQEIKVNVRATLTLESKS